MKSTDLDYRWMKVKNGRLHLAVVNLNIVKNEIENLIIENYPKEEFCDNSIEVGENGWEDWKKGLRKGLEFALSNSSDFWTITINGLSGKPFMDTNPTIVGYTGILAFVEMTNTPIDEEILQQLEAYVFRSWEGDNAEKVPDFNNLMIEEVVPVNLTGFKRLLGFITNK
ncbi:hypothetical protein [uncultured Flavobacterium sp.]|uniref:hypothetical protein n=1 Tax=uncultured Flavobacterium sp. TaxID=165435 RepID=UPI00292CF3A6|nr:hypothetical protein [uncultured Flavobacterium sp.]